MQTCVLSQTFILHTNHGFSSVQTSLLEIEIFLHVSMICSKPSSDSLTRNLSFIRSHKAIFAYRAESSKYYIASNILLCMTINYSTLTVQGYIVFVCKQNLDISRKEQYIWLTYLMAQKTLIVAYLWDK